MSGPERLRIAMLVRAYPTVSETFIRDQIHALRRRGHEVNVYALYVSTRPNPGTLDEDDVRYLIGRELSLGGAAARGAGRLLRSLADPGALLRLAPLILRQPRIVAEAIHAIPRLRGSRRDYHVVHAHFGPTGLLALALRRSRRLTGAVVTTFHGYDITRYPARRGRDPYAPLFDAGDAFTVNSGFTERRALELGAPADRLRRIPMGVDVSGIPFAPRTHEPGGALSLLSVGRLEPVKGLDIGLRAVAELARDHDVRYTVVGTGRLASELRASAARLGIADRVRFTGALPFREVVEEYARHDVFLMPGVMTADGQEEAQGRVLVEAQAAGLPVVASRVGGIPETMAEDAGVLVPPGDPGAVANAVHELLRHPDRWPAMGRAGRNHVETHYDADALLDDLVDAYYRALQHRKEGR